MDLRFHRSALDVNDSRGLDFLLLYLLLYPLVIVSLLVFKFNKVVDYYLITELLLYLLSLVVSLLVILSIIY